MKNLKILFILLALLVTTVSCTDEFDNSVGNNEECILGEERFVDLQFGHGTFEDVNISTRATTDGQLEWRIQNLYVLIFKSGGTAAENVKVYGKYFDIDNRQGTKKEVLDAYSEAWWVESATAKLDENNNIIEENGYKVLDVPSHGIIRMRVPTGNNFKIYVIANTEAGYLGISPETLDGIKTEKEFRDFNLRLIGTPNLRTNLMMVGEEDGVKISVNPKNEKEADIRHANGQDFAFNNDPKTNRALELKRMDAKIEFRIHINAHKNPKLKEFIPKSWQVINLPKSAKMVQAMASSYHPASGEGNFYNTLPVIFERTLQAYDKTGKPILDAKGQSVPEHIFSFYMLENYPDNAGKGTVTKYHDRDLRRKNPDGTYADGDMWVNAPNNATYVKIVGQLEMATDDNELGEPQTLFADVVYYIHLGDFARDVNDYNVERNTRYTYKISINDVKSIETEVETSKGDQPFQEPETGATGDIYVAKEDVRLFDAHYGQHVFRFNQAYIDDNVTWYVQTPFTPNGGAPQIIDGIPVTTGLDYKWVRFFRNHVNSDGHYSKGNRWYPGNKYTPTSGKAGDRLMYVDEFVKYIKDQKHKYDAGEPNDFLPEEIEGKPTQYVIYMTVFVDENVYEVNPFTGEKDPYLWTKTVNNCGDRILHVLCDNQQSLDNESSMTNSVISIRQRSIQTPYTQKEMKNEKGEPLCGWGCEIYDESGVNYATAENALPFNISGINYKTDPENGLYNTARLSNVLNQNDWSSYFNVVKTYPTPNANFAASGWELPEGFDPDVVNPNTERDNVHFLKSNYKNLRYTFLLRNRDNNGNGKIDKDELRWYIASLNQLTQLYLGGSGISGDAQIYPEKIANGGSTTINGNNIDLWRQHIISSSVLKDSHKPRLLWAEEGVSISDYGQEWTKKAINTVRCLRNLGTKEFNPSDVKSQPDNLIIVTRSNGNSGNYRFDMSRVARVSLRGGGEVDPNLRTTGVTDENNTFALLPLGFETGSRQPIGEWLTQDKKNQHIENLRKYDKHFQNATEVKDFDILKYIYDNGLEKDYPGPKGYRLPNIREAALISAYCDEFNIKDDLFMITTYYSFGFYGWQKPQEGNNRSWVVGKDFISLNGTITHFRFVRDWQP